LDQRKETGYGHVGLDLHKKRTEVAVMDEQDDVIDRCELKHDDTTAGEYLSNIGRAGIATAEETRNWYWLNELLEECGLAVKLAHPQKAKLTPRPGSRRTGLMPGRWSISSGPAFCRRHTFRPGQSATAAS